MANIKISELNELETRHRNDLLAIVDSVNNETKKVKVENLINENVELIAVSPTAPSECSLGDKYFNTTSNKIYTAIATDTWSSTGENAVEGILYIVFNEQSTYAYNGTTLVSVGGGSGSSDIVVVPTETPTEDTKLEIEDEDFDFKGSEITDEYSESTEVGYSANYSNGHFQGKRQELWINENTSSNFGAQTITIQNLSNYNLLKIIYKQNKNEAYYKTDFLENVVGYRTYLDFADTAAAATWIRAVIIKENNQIQFNDARNNSTNTVSAGDCIPYKIIGYKEV